MSKSCRVCSCDMSGRSHRMYCSLECARSIKHLLPPLKLCTKCGVEKSIEQYGSATDTVDGLTRTCKACNYIGHMLPVSTLKTYAEYIEIDKSKDWSKYKRK